MHNKFKKKIVRGLRRYQRVIKYGLGHSKVPCEKSEYILIVVHTGVRGGAPVLALHLIRQLKKQNKKVVAILLDSGEMLSEFENECPTFVTLSDAAFKKQVDEITDKVIIGKCICNSALTGKGIPYLKEKNIKIVSLVHELPNALQAAYATEDAKIMTDNSDVMIFPSTIVKNRFFEIIEPSLKVRAFVQPQGKYLSSEHTCSREEAREWFEKKYGLLPNQRIVLNVASVSNRKGFDIFVDIAEKNPSICFVWIGINETTFYKYIKNQYQGSFPENLIEVGYIDDANELFMYYYAADVFALTSREEPFGSVVLEAFSAGTPVVAFRGCGGFEDIVKNGETGFLASEVTAESMMEQISLVLNSKVISDELRKNCKEVAGKMTFDNYVRFICDKFD